MKKTIIITRIYNNDEYLYIESYNNIYSIHIINGSITCKIYNIYNKELFLCDLNVDDRISIYYNKNNNISKILVHTQYILLSDSSDENYEYI
jgi:hypothetical protein